MTTPRVRIDTMHISDDPEQSWDGLGVSGALALALSLGSDGLHPGLGRTLELFETLATLAADDLAVARVVEPHLDALAILAQAGIDDSSHSPSTWGVFAAEGPVPLGAELVDGHWILSGTKPWCSLADRLDRALISATDGSRQRHLFAVDLHDPGVEVEAGAWHARGLTEIASGPVHFTAVAATEVGEAGWYLERAGFAWGGMCVAACWYGGAVGIARFLFDAIASRPGAGDIPLMHLGRLDEALTSARLSLSEAAEAIDDGSAVGAAASLLAKRVRATTVRAAELAILTCGHALGPGPLATDERHAKRIADLELYIRQHHAEKDEASLGATLLKGGTPPW